MSEFKKYDTVFWNDPDNNVSSGDYTVISVNGDVLTLEADDGSEVEAMASECRHQEWRDENIPNWAACYMENRDASGLVPDDKTMVDIFMANMRKEGYVRHNWTDDRNDFCHYPAFGLACDTTRVRFYKKMEGEK